MADRNYPLDITTAIQNADLQALASIAIELVGLVQRYESKKQGGRDRTKRWRESQDVTSRNAGNVTNVTAPDGFPSDSLSLPPASPSSSSSALVTRISDRLPSDAGRAALTTILAAGNGLAVASEIGMILDGGRPGTPHQPQFVELALCDYAANGMSDGRFNAIHFRRHVQRAAKPEAQPAAQGSPIAGEWVAKIRALVKQIPGRNSYIPKNEVALLGPEVLKAYESVGGAERFLSIQGKDMGYLIRDFSNAMRGVA